MGRKRTVQSKRGFIDAIRNTGRKAQQVLRQRQGIFIDKKGARTQRRAFHKAQWRKGRLFKNLLRPQL